MKAMGIETDQEVVQMVGRDPRYGDLLYLSIQVTYYFYFVALLLWLYYNDDPLTVLLFDLLDCQSLNLSGRLNFVVFALLGMCHRENIYTTASFAVHG